MCDLVSSLWRRGGFLTTGFLNAATALEGYHHSVSAKEKESSEQRARRKRVVSLVGEEDHDWVNDHLRLAYPSWFVDIARRQRETLRGV